MNQNTKVLITGVLGFIGSHTAKAFKQAGYFVVGIDNQWTAEEGVKFTNHLVIDDFADRAPSLIDKYSIDSVIHIAGTSLVGPSIKNPGPYYHNNVGKTNQLLSTLANQKWGGKFIFSSSAATYGNNCEVPIKETAQGNPVSPYGYSKKMCEQIIADHTHAHGLRSIALRYFNAAGCDNDGELGNVWNDTHLIPVIIQKFLEQKQIVINGNNFSTKDGTCVRDYLHVNDIADAHVKALELCNEFNLGEFRAYNLGTGTGYSNFDILKAVESVTGKSLDYKFGPKRDGDPDSLIADSTAFQKDAKWTPNHSDLTNIVKTTYNWMYRLNH